MKRPPLLKPGGIHTSDGQQVDFDLRLTMTREFRQQDDSHIRLEKALKDPLVVNYSGTVANLLQSTHLFDMVADGGMDTTSHLSPGSGYLALDANSDGVVNDGSEFFGALSGMGFTDLAHYDSDGNGWIDENDALFVDLPGMGEGCTEQRTCEARKKRNRSD